MKNTIDRIVVKNEIIDNIIDAIVSRDTFLVVGHKNPDEDCIASTVAMALLLSKFYKKTAIFQSYKIHERFDYLINICKYNAIEIVTSESEIPDTIDTVVCCDTPKPDMLDSCGRIESLLNDEKVLKIEIDHHIGADSKYLGDEGYCLVDEASSTCELIGRLALKLTKKQQLLRDYKIEDLLSRNIVLAILTGVVGDSKLGSFLKSRREKRYYDILSNVYNSVLSDTTTKTTNLSNIKEIFDELQRLSKDEEECSQYVIRSKSFSSSIGFVILDEKAIDTIRTICDGDTLASVARKITDTLARESRKLGLIAHHDYSTDSDLVQFKLRRSKEFKSFDLRKVLDIFSIENGGGHEGAIGFRIPKEKIGDLNDYVDTLIIGIEKALPAEHNSN
ncbi:MAG: phosphoesterase [Proteobacteria bacterium]|nr:phosphoesterase [Pseudomonadota bacterium]